MKNNKKTFALYFVIAFALFTLIFTTSVMAFDGLLSSKNKSNKDDDKKDKTASVDEVYPYYVEPGEDFVDEYGSKERINILLMGIEDVRADTIMLASYDPKEKNVALVSIPRDTYFPRSGHNNPGAKKINAAYSSDKEMGIAESVSEILGGMPINFYASISYDGVAEIVDTMGGVPVTIPFNMVYDDPRATPPLHINLKKGEQVLDGKEAVQFLRFRKGNKGHPGYSEGDIGRIAAQQEFMKSAFKQMLSLKLPMVASTVIKNVNTDISFTTAAKLATGAIGMEHDAISAFQIPGEARNGEADLSFFYVDEDKVSDLVRSIYSDDFLTLDDE